VSSSDPNGELHVSPFLLALALSLGACVSLGITRFSYGLLLPPMRADLGWSYTLAGSMNTSNALGYFVGALMAPWLIRRFKVTNVIVIGALLASVFMGLSGFFTDSTMLLVQRCLAGVVSAWVFITGGLLAARLGALDPNRSGLLIGLYYGGSGIGITVSALLVPTLLAELSSAQKWYGYAAWAWAWWALALVCLIASVVLIAPARLMRPLMKTSASQQAQPSQFRVGDFAFALAGYAMFGVGYIGYMTFVIALLREQGASAQHIMTFYALPGMACMASFRVWAGLLDRHKSGRALATLNALLGVATILPALTSAWPVVLLSGIIFGGVFLSVVASTTALVRHNALAHDWPAGISAFTVVFAAGQIIGPVVVGWIADSAAPGNAASSSDADANAHGLARGLIFSAIALWIGALLASRQKALNRTP
jgi:predicted MFS family arabinose efflux permease